MKRKFALAFIMLTTSGYYVSGQSTGEPQKPVKTGNEWRMPADVIARCTLFADTVTKVLGLDAATHKKLFDAYLANTKPVDEIVVLPIGDDDKKARLKANKLAFNETIKNILTPAQYDGYVKKGFTAYKPAPQKYRE